MLFDDVYELCPGVRGQDRARGYFRQALKSGRLSHAYLLAGPRGVGKRRFAGELAAALLCREQGGGACGECVSCRTLASGNHMGFFVLEVGERTSIEIDAVRELGEALSLRATGRRVVVIDDADRLTVPASNAVLKTLEEPPPGIVFLLVTSRPAHLLETIHSRCHRVPFTSLGVEDFAAVVAAGGVDTDGLDVDRIHAAAGGSPGRALALLSGIEECGGPERFAELLEGRGRERPETLVDFVPPRGKEPQRTRVERLLDLVLQGHWADRGADPDDREARARRAVAIAELQFDLRGNLNPELILESLAGLE